VPGHPSQTQSEAAAAGPAPAARFPVMLTTEGWGDYALLDAGNGLKLEQYGPYRIVRPEPQALWQPRLPASAWDSADAVFTGDKDEDSDGRWKFRARLPESWRMAYGKVAFLGRFTAFRHVGVFPEQDPHWRWIESSIRRAQRPVRVLNLFGYTGIASFVAAEAGAEVTHVDASKKAIAWARENQTLSGMDALPIRWIMDDAMKFVQREERRGKRYDGIILDPPKFGRGPKGETFDIFLDLPEMMRACRRLLSDDPLFLILTAYSIRASFMAIHELTLEAMAGKGGTVESGELLLKEQSGERLLSTSLFSRWSPHGA
jgi:23S rRNA (cytosine1962-C5)-methyltransferase